MCILHIFFHLYKPHPFIQVQYEQIFIVVYPLFMHVAASKEHSSVLVKLDKCMGTAGVGTSGILC